MTAVASEATGKAATGQHDPAMDLIEDQRDRHETWMIYGEGHKFPRIVALVWVVAMVSLGAYLFLYAVPDFAKWGK